MGKKKPRVLLDVACSFGKVSFGEASVSVPVTLSRDDLNIDAADALLVGRRVTLEIIANGGDQANQQRLPGLEEEIPQIKAIAESKKMGVGRKHYSATLNFQLSDVEESEPQHFANKAGRLLVFSVDELPEGKRGRPANRDGDDDEEAEEE